MSKHHNLKNKKIAILATSGFEQSELLKPKEMLTEQGAEVEVLSIDGQDTITGWDQNNWGDKVPVDGQLATSTPGDYDAVILPGGQINPDILRNNELAVSFIKRAHAETRVRVIGAICHGPWLLIESELVSNSRLTSFPSIKTDLMNAGAVWEDSDVVHDGKLVTSRNPNDIPAFVEKISELVA